MCIQLKLEIYSTYQDMNFDLLLLRSYLTELYDLVKFYQLLLTYLTKIWFMDIGDKSLWSW